MEDNDLVGVPKHDPTIKIQNLRCWADTLEENSTEKSLPKENFDDPLHEVQKDTVDSGGLASYPSTSKFPFKPEINKKIVLWMGDIWNLNADVIVNSTNETLNDFNPISSELLHRAGPELIRDLEGLESCRTGEAKMTKAHKLPARYIFHTVGPRYNEKYRTAAENALHNCYRSCLQLLKEHNLKTIAYCVINSETRGYPGEVGAHIALRTVRRFLEKWGEDIEKVIFCVQKEDDLKLYQKILPLYCPRSEAEALRSEQILPRDTGNEVGETVIEERKIRISAFPSNDQEEYYSSLGEEKSANIFTMQSDTDEERKRRANSKTRAQRIAEEAAVIYQQYLAKARKTDLSDIARLNLLYQSGVDGHGRPIMVFVANRLPENNLEQLERVFLYIIKLMDSIADKDYIIVYLHTGMSDKSKPEFGWLRRMYNVIDAKYCKNLRTFYVLHPTFWLKLVQSFFSTFTGSEFWNKVRYVERLMDLFHVLDPDQLKIPDEVYKFDHTATGSPYTSSSVARQPGQFGENL